MAISSAALSLGDAAIRQLDGLYSLNDLHAAAGGAAKHRPGYFLTSGQAKALASEIATAGIPAVHTVNGGPERGTYACRELVIAYAAWISAAFHLKVIRVFLAQAAQPPAEHPMAYKRMLVSFDHLGRPTTPQMLPDDARVLSVSGMAEAINSPIGGGWSNETLLDLAEAIHTRLGDSVQIGTWDDIAARMNNGERRPVGPQALAFAEAATRNAFSEASNLPKGPGAEIAQAIHDAGDALSLADLQAIATAATMNVWRTTLAHTDGRAGKAGSRTKALIERAGK